MPFSKVPLTISATPSTTTMAMIHSSAISCIHNRHIKSLPLGRVAGSVPVVSTRKRSSRFICRAIGEQDDGYLLDAPVSIGDGFSFSGGEEKE
ncbi:hypothetical protein AKJ16_DCAP24115, partial [Drosera capensis]